MKYVEELIIVGVMVGGEKRWEFLKILGWPWYFVVRKIEVSP